MFAIRSGFKHYCTEYNENTSLTLHNTILYYLLGINGFLTPSNY